jgi:hypothetical protein
MVFFFRPLYTVFVPHGHKHQITQPTMKKALKNQKSLAQEPGPPRSWRIQGGSREGGAELKHSGAERGRRSEGGLPSACRGRWPRRRGSCSWRRRRRRRRRWGSPLPPVGLIRVWDSGGEAVEEMGRGRRGWGECVREWAGFWIEMAARSASFGLLGWPMRRRSYCYSFFPPFWNLLYLVMVTLVWLHFLNWDPTFISNW